MARRSGGGRGKTDYTPYVIAGGAGLALALLARSVFGGTSGPLRGTLFTLLVENRSASQLLDPRGPTPYLASLAARYAQATNYRSSSRPSLPNYLKLIAGRDFGVHDDGYHAIGGTDNLFAQMTAAGIPWRAYAETMGQPCRRTDGATYAVRHNPATYFVLDEDACREHVVDLDRALWADLAADRVKYAWISPSEVHNAHDGTLAQLDAWLRVTIPRLMASPGYRKGGAIIITADEPSFGSGVADPTRLPFVVISPRVPEGLRDATPYDHRSYTAMVEDLFGLSRLPSTQGVRSIARMFA